MSAETEEAVCGNAYAVFLVKFSVFACALP